MAPAVMPYSAVVRKGSHHRMGLLFNDLVKVKAEKLRVGDRFAADGVLDMDAAGILLEVTAKSGDLLTFETVEKPAVSVTRFNWQIGELFTIAGTSSN